MGFGAEADGRRKRLSRQHVGAVQLAGDHPVQQHLPVRLGLKGDEQAFILEIPLLIGNRERGHVRQFDEAELQLVFFHIEHFGAGRSGQGGGANQRGR